MDGRTVRVIRLVPKQISLGRNLAEWAAVSGVLLAMVGISRVWFDGSAIIDTFAVVATIALIITLANLATGRDVFMTPVELRDYVNAGCPADAKAWVEDHRIYGSGVQ